LAPVLIGDRAVGEILVDHPKVPLVSATGSTRMGRDVGPRLAKRFARAVLELGGNDPLIVLNDLSDEDLAKAADLAVAGATKNSGQRCTAVKRILVQEKVADRFVSMVLERAKAIKFG
ncbi:aldehyde dehydrogenase family protein, partial [Mesorhizobium sp. M1D.F.Ca.ET.234.01.1.1]|uniref:aldehyde dehydrogenase family protein n=1 Tax=Mesorhizobium sp. M1D.F.Ca.ET.234.01.1.1 TaxID=2563932 RepID=UPI001AED63E2